MPPHTLDIAHAPVAAEYIVAASRLPFDHSNLP